MLNAHKLVMSTSELTFFSGLKGFVGGDATGAYAMDHPIPTMCYDAENTLFVKGT